MARKTKIETLVCTTVTTQRTVKLSAALIMEAFGLPLDARITFRVPGGGDWSGEAVEIDEQNPVWVEWSTTETRDERQ